MRIQWHTINSVDTYSMIYNDYVECMLEKRILFDSAKYGWDHHGVVNKIEICLETRYQDISASRFLVKHY